MHDFLIALGLVLDRSWGHLGTILGSKKWLSPYVFQCFLNIVIFEQMTVQDAFLTQLDPIWAPKRVPRDAQDEPKTDPRRVQNRVQNRVEKMIEKWTAQGSMAGIGPHTFEPWMPTGGVGGESSKQPEDQYLRSSTPLGLKAWRIFFAFSHKDSH